MKTITAIRQRARRQHVRLLLLLVAAIVFAGRGSGRPIDAEEPPCDIACENAKPGNQPSEWDVAGAGDPEIQGFATDISVNRGDTVSFKIDSTTSYDIHIYRLGYYADQGARKVGQILNLSGDVTQPSCLSEPATGLVDCGNWTESASWPTFEGADAVPSGVYVAKLVRHAGGGGSHILFIVRDDAAQADMVFQTSDTTWQAYNTFGGNSLYCGGPLSNAGTAYTSCAGRAAKVSYNRPIDTRGTHPSSSFFNAEYPMLRWLEANGYHVKYWAGVDSDRRGGDLLVAGRKPKVFLSVGHDEYWSGAQRTHVEAARDGGVSLAFFSGNEMFWKTRWENDRVADPSFPGDPTKTVAGPVTHRTLVSYKETLATTSIDPTSTWTGTWRDSRAFNPEGGKPENSVTGTLWTVNCCSHFINVPEALGKLRFWRHTPMAALPVNTSAQTPMHTLGYEWDEDIDNGARPAGMIRLSLTTTDVFQQFQEPYGVSPGISTHALTLYRRNDALVFGAGTVQWSWGLDSTHDGFATPTDLSMRQATVNLFADMGVSPATLQDDLVSGGAAPDTDVPSAIVSAPAAGATVEIGKRVVIAGTAADIGGGRVAAVEVSDNGGATWHPAQGRETWSYEWVPSALGAIVLQVRAVDDSANVGAIATHALTVGPSGCPCTSLWNPAITVPPVGNRSFNDFSTYELGVRFSSEQAGFITGLRFYRGPNDTASHAAQLWTSTGVSLKAVTFPSASGEGWQEASFSSPVAITANTIYVASYTTNAFYAATNGYFNTAVDSPPLHVAAGNSGAFSAGGFPSTATTSNYWIDVVFAPPPPDTNAPIISGITAFAIDSNTASVSWTTDELSTTKVFYGTDPDTLSQSIVSNAVVTSHATTMTGLTPTTLHYYRVVSVDLAGNQAMSPPAGDPPATFTPPLLQGFLDTTVLDFTAPGTVRTNTYATQSTDGEIILTPTVEDFIGTGSGLPADWAAPLVFNTGGFAEVQYPDTDNPTDGVLMINGAMVKRSGFYTPGRSLEFLATIGPDANQHTGFATNFNTGEPWAIFSTAGTDNVLWARTNRGVGGFIDEPITVPNLLNVPHLYRIDWNADGFVYFIDGVEVASHAIPVAGPMQMLAASDFDGEAQPINTHSLAIDYMLIKGPYTASSGTFESRVFDAGAVVDWYNVSWTKNTPAGTTLAIDIRTGNATSSMGPWTPVAVSGMPLVGVVGRYAQYRATLDTSDPATVAPELRDVALNHYAGAANNPPVAYPGSQTTPEDTPLLGSVAPLASDPDDNPLTFIRESGPSHGLLTVNLDGSYSYTPAANFNGADSFVYRVSDGAGGIATATVSLLVTPVPDAGDDAYAVLEDQGLSIAAPGILANDTNDGGPTSLTALLATGPQHGNLVLNADGSFTYTPFPNYSGPDGFFYRATDGNVQSNVAGVSILVNVANDAPVALAESYNISKVGVPVSIASIVLDGDGSTARATTTIEHGFASGHPVTVTGAAQPEYNGTFLVIATGPTTFAYTVIGSPAPTASGTITAVAADRTRSVAAPGVLGNDTDEEGNALSAVLVSGPAAGNTLTLNADGSFIYTPAESFVGADSFTYKANDANSDSNVVTVSIAVYAEIESRTVGASGGTVATGSNATATDPVETSVTTPIPGVVTIIEEPISGLPGESSAAGYSFLGQQVQISISTITDAMPLTDRNNPLVMTFTLDTTQVAPDQNENTVQVFRNGVLVPDCLGATALPAELDRCVSSRVRLVNGPDTNGDLQFTILTLAPSHWGLAVLLANDDSVTVDEDQAVDGNLASLVNVPDVTGLTFAQGATAPAHGTLTVNADGTFTYQGAADYNGPDSFTYTVTDAHGASDTGTVSITVTPVNDPPSFQLNSDQTVPEDAGPQSVAGLSTAITAGPADENGQTLNFIVTNTNPALFSAQPAVDLNGTLSYTPAPDAYGTATVTVRLHDDGGTDNGGSDTSAGQTFVITVTAVNDAPSFAMNAGPIALYGNPPAQTMTNWATGISAGPANEGGQVLTFLVSNNNNGLFASQPALSANGTLTFATAANVNGTATVTVALSDGVNTSAPQTFVVAVNVAPSTTTLTSSNPQSLAGLPITFTATVNADVAGAGTPTMGTVTFWRGTVQVGLPVPLSPSGVATLTMTNLGVGIHSIKAAYSGGGNFLGSTSAAITQNVGASAMLSVKFSIHTVMDGTSRPRVQQVPVAGAEVRVYSRTDTCTNGIVVSGQPKTWGPIFDGLDGYNATGDTDPGCPIVTSGNYVAVGTTNASGDVSIIVPPLATSSADYIVIGRTLDYDYTQTVPGPDAMYTEKTIDSLSAGQIKRARLHHIRLFNGKKVPGRDIEEFGSYLAIVEPEYMEWSSDVEQYPFVLIAEGDWGVTTAVEPPEGFVSDYPELAADVVDEVSAVQFTITDIGSDWTHTKVSHTIRHKGKTKKRDSEVPMYDKKPTTAKDDDDKVKVDSANNVLDLLKNDTHSHAKRPLRITGITAPAHGTAVVSADESSVSYTPNPGFTGEDTFTYTMTDATGASSTATVTITVNGSGEEVNLAHTERSIP